MSIPVSVIIPARNATATLGDTLRAVHAQICAPPFEIIVVDNDSSDDTARVAGAAGVRVLHESRRGPSAARNCGLAAAQAEIVAYLDADTLPTRRWLAELTAPFANAHILLVSGRNLSYAPQTSPERFMAQHVLHGLEYRTVRQVFPFASSQNMAVRRSAALAVGGWAEDMPTGEDVDFSYRILQKFGSGLVHQPTAVLFHRERRSAEALHRQAYGWGEGLAHMYLRYPETAQWKLAQWFDLGWTLAARALAPLAFQLRRADLANVEHARWHWRWSVAYWGGFTHMLLTHQRREN